MSRSALDLKKAGWPSEEIKKYSPWQALERHRASKRFSSRRDRAWAVAKKAAEVLREKYGASRVILFGSLSYDSWFSPRSDIDLCVEGVPVKSFFRAESEIEEISSGFRLDLLDIRECSPELLKHVEREGIEL